MRTANSVETQHRPIEIRDDGVPRRNNVILAHWADFNVLRVGVEVREIDLARAVQRVLNVGNHNRRKFLEGVDTNDCAGV